MKSPKEHPPVFHCMSQTRLLTDPELPIFSYLYNSLSLHSIRMSAYYVQDVVSYRDAQLCG